MVRNATTVAGVTSKSVTAYTPTVMMMSWITAMIAASAMRHSKRNVRYAAITKKNTISAVSALLLTLSPQVGPTLVTLTCAPSMPAYLASAALTFASWAVERFFDCTRTELLPTMSTFASPSPSGSMASRTLVTETDALFAIVNCHCVPPSKSIPRLRPLTSERDDRDQDERAGENGPAPRPFDELEVGALVVQVGERVTALRRRTGRCGRGRHVVTPAGASRPAAMPTPGMLTSDDRRAMIETTGCMKK